MNGRRFSGTECKMRALILAVWIAMLALHVACEGRSGLESLREMPAIAEAVVASGDGRIFPSAVGPGDELLIPEEHFALSGALAEVRTNQRNNGERVVATIAAGDRVEILVANDDSRGLCLIRTQKGTYCWLSSSALTCHSSWCPKQAKH